MLHISVRGRAAVPLTERSISAAFHAERYVTPSVKNHYATNYDDDDDDVQ